MAAMDDVPHLETIGDIFKMSDEIKDWAARHPLRDHVYYISDDEFDPSDVQTNNFVVAGSSSLHRILRWIYSTRQIKWKAGDSDFFILGQSKCQRLNLGGVDIVLVKNKTIPDLLLDFDLPVCRVGFDIGNGLYISLQCINAILTKKQNIPKYLQNRFSFIDTMEKECYTTEGVRFNFLYERFCQRCKKYQERGFGVNWIDDDTIVEWVRNRFGYHYASKSTDGKKGFLQEPEFDESTVKCEVLDCTGGDTTDSPSDRAEYYMAHE